MQPVNVYLNNLHAFQHQIAKIPPLCHEQVCSYAKQVKWAKQLQHLKLNLLKKLGQAPTFAQWAHQAQLSEPDLNAALKSGQRAKHRLVEGHLYLVVAIARRYQNRGVELPDLIQEGAIGLNRAVEKFEADKGCKLSTYSYWWIEGHIRRAIALRNKDTSTIALEESRQLFDQLESPSPLPEEIVTQLQQVELLRQFIGQLPKRKQEVLMLKYGLTDDKRPCSLTQVATKLGLTLEQVRWAHDTGLELLRKMQN